MLAYVAHYSYMNDQTYKDGCQIYEIADICSKHNIAQEIVYQPRIRQKLYEELPVLNQNTSYQVKLLISRIWITHKCLDITN